MSRASVILLSLVVMVLLTFSSIHLPTINELTYGFLGSDVTETKILFVGDVMLGRYVETLIKENSSAYPFIGMDSLTGRYDHVIGNFEAPIAKEHTQTKPESFRFSIATTSITSLGEYFSAFSLANNHTFDQEDEGLIFTQQQLAKETVNTFGLPNSVGTSSVLITQHGDKKIALVGLNAVSKIDATSTLQLLSSLNTSSDMQIFYMHWGTEYELTHNHTQEELAHMLIDNGADLIIGHHPHVVQDIAMYKGVPIFYSLGNFVFDQYFDEQVQIGLGVELSLRNEEVSYRLIPFTSLHSQSSPRLMTVAERELFLADISAKSSPNIAQKLKESGQILIADTLASL